MLLAEVRLTNDEATALGWPWTAGQPANEPMRRTLAEGPALSDLVWMTAAEAADYLRLPSTKALYQRAARGQVTPYILGRSMRFRRRDLDALLRPMATRPRRR